MNVVWDVNLFYPLVFLLLFLTILCITFYSFKNKDTFLFGKIHTDTTDKMHSMHNKVVDVTWSREKEIELHNIEKKLHYFEKIIENLNTRMIYLEKK